MKHTCIIFVLERRHALVLELGSPATRSPFDVLIDPILLIGYPKERSDVGKRVYILGRLCFALSFPNRRSSFEEEVGLMDQEHQRIRHLSVTSV
jgi:hypothetical protein